MKANFVCFKLSKTMIALIVIIVIQLTLIIFGIKEIRETSSFEQMQNEANIMQRKNENTSLEMKKQNMGNSKNETNEQKNENEIIQSQNEYKAKQINENESTQGNDIKENESIQGNDISEYETMQESKLEEYKNMPRELRGYKVIGKIEIPKVKLSTYVLAETNKKSLKVSVTKLCGPEINKVGNFCIAGHNYINNKMFGGIKKLEIGDEITLTDTYDRKVKYQVYDTYKTSPKDVSCLDGETGGEREITLITCTAGAIQRVIVKAVEVYD